MEQQKIERAQAKIRRIQEGYEADPPVYTASEAEEKIRVYRDMIAQAQTEVKRLQEFMEQQAIDKVTKKEARRILETLRNTNLENANFAEKQDLIAKLGMRVYPSEDGKVVRIASKLQPIFSTPKVSRQKISMASPKL